MMMSPGGHGAAPAAPPEAQLAGGCSGGGGGGGEGGRVLHWADLVFSPSLLDAWMRTADTDDDAAAYELIQSLLDQARASSTVSIKSALVDTADATAPADPQPQLQLHPASPAPPPAPSTTTNSTAAHRPPSSERSRVLRQLAVRAACLVGATAVDIDHRLSLVAQRELVDDLAACHVRGECGALAAVERARWVVRRATSEAVTGAPVNCRAVAVAVGVGVGVGVVVSAGAGAQAPVVGAEDEAAATALLLRVVRDPAIALGIAHGFDTHVTLGGGADGAAVCGMIRAPVAAVQVQCQVAFDLGELCFARQKYDDADECFGTCDAVLAEARAWSSQRAYVVLDDGMLTGYRAALAARRDASGGIEGESAHSQSESRALAECASLIPPSRGPGVPVHSGATGDSLGGAHTVDVSSAAVTAVTASVDVGSAAVTAVTVGVGFGSTWLAAHTSLNPADVSHSSVALSAWWAHTSAVRDSQDGTRKEKEKERDWDNGSSGRKRRRSLSAERERDDGRVMWASRAGPSCECSLSVLLWDGGGLVPVDAAAFVHHLSREGGADDPDSFAANRAVHLLQRATALGAALDVAKATALFSELSEFAGARAQATVSREGPARERAKKRRSGMRDSWNLLSLAATYAPLDLQRRLFSLRGGRMDAQCLQRFMEALASPVAIPSADTLFGFLGILLDGGYPELGAARSYLGRLRSALSKLASREERADAASVCECASMLLGVFASCADDPLRPFHAPRNGEPGLDRMMTALAEHVTTGTPDGDWALGAQGPPPSLTTPAARFALRQLRSAEALDVFLAVAVATANRTLAEARPDATQTIRHPRRPLGPLVAGQEHPGELSRDTTGSAAAQGGAAGGVSVAGDVGAGAEAAVDVAGALGMDMGNGKRELTDAAVDRVKSAPVDAPVNAAPVTAVKDTESRGEGVQLADGPRRVATAAVESVCELALQACRHHPDDARYWAVAGDALHAAGRWAPAAACHVRAIVLCTLMVGCPIPIPPTGCASMGGWGGHTGAPVHADEGGAFGGDARAAEGVVFASLVEKSAVRLALSLWHLGRFFAAAAAWQLGARTDAMWAVGAVRKGVAAVCACGGAFPSTSAQWLWDPLLVEALVCAFASHTPASQADAQRGLDHVTRARWLAARPELTTGNDVSTVARARQSLARLLLCALDDMFDCGKLLEGLVG